MMHRKKEIKRQLQENGMAEIGSDEENLSSSYSSDNESDEDQVKPRPDTRPTQKAQVKSRHDIQPSQKAQVKSRHDIQPTQKAQVKSRHDIQPTQKAQVKSRPTVSQSIDQKNSENLAIALELLSKVLASEKRETYFAKLIQFLNEEAFLLKIFNNESDEDYNERKSIAESLCKALELKIQADNSDTLFNLLVHTLKTIYHHKDFGNWRKDNLDLATFFKSTVRPRKNLMEKLDDDQIKTKRSLFLECSKNAIMRFEKNDFRGIDRFALIAHRVLNNENSRLGNVFSSYMQDRLTGKDIKVKFSNTWKTYFSSERKLYEKTIGFINQEISDDPIDNFANQFAYKLLQYVAQHERDVIQFAGERERLKDVFDLAVQLLKSHSQRDLRKARVMATRLIAKKSSMSFPENDKLAPILTKLETEINHRDEINHGSQSGTDEELKMDGLFWQKLNDQYYNLACFVKRKLSFDIRYIFNDNYKKLVWEATRLVNAIYTAIHTQNLYELTVILNSSSLNPDSNKKPSLYSLFPKSEVFDIFRQVSLITHNLANEHPGQARRFCEYIVQTEAFPYELRKSIHEIYSNNKQKSLAFKKMSHEFATYVAKHNSGLFAFFSSDLNQLYRDTIKKLSDGYFANDNNFQKIRSQNTVIS